MVGSEYLYPIKFYKNVLGFTYFKHDFLKHIVDVVVTHENYSPFLSVRKKFISSSQNETHIVPSNYLNGANIEYNRKAKSCPYTY